VSAKSIRRMWLEHLATTPPRNDPSEFAPTVGALRQLRKTLPLSRLSLAKVLMVPVDKMDQLWSPGMEDEAQAPLHAISPASVAILQALMLACDSLRFEDIQVFATEIQRAMTFAPYGGRGNMASLAALNVVLSRVYGTSSGGPGSYPKRWL